MKSIRVGSRTSDTDFLAAYQLIRDYVREENGLVAERISRTLLVHGFLIASFVLLIQAKAQAIAQAGTAAAADQGTIAARLAPIFALADLAMPAIAVMGVLTSLTAFLGVIAAAHSIGRLRRQADTLMEQHDAQAQRLCTPAVTGGGRPLAAAGGWIAAQGLLLLLISFWALISAWSVALLRDPSSLVAMTAAASRLPQSSLQ